MGKDFRANAATFAGLVGPFAIQLITGAVLFYVGLSGLSGGAQPFSSAGVTILGGIGLMRVFLLISIERIVAPRAHLGSTDLVAATVFGRVRSIPYSKIACVKIATTRLYRALRIEGGVEPIDLSFEIVGMSDLIVEILHRAENCRVVDVLPQLEKHWWYGAGYVQSPALSDILSQRKTISVRMGNL